MTEKFEDRYFDVLQNIESAIVHIYEEHPELMDYNVDKALAGLIRVYQTRIKEQAAPHLPFKPLEQQLYEAVKEMCDWRLGEIKLQEDEEVVLEPKTLDEMVACLKRIRRSVSLWTKQGGRQGYLTYIASFLGG